MSLLSQVTVSAVGLFSKALLNVGFCSSVTVKGLDNLLKALEDDERNNGRGIVTSELRSCAGKPHSVITLLSVSNHIST